MTRTRAQVVRERSPEAVLVDVDFSATRAVELVPVQGTVCAAAMLQLRQAGARRQLKKVEHHEEACAGRKARTLTSVNPRPNHKEA